MTSDPKSTNGGLGEAAKPHYLGHRERARDRFNALGGEALADYELLELLLHMVLPERDTKALAKDLLARFGTISEILGAPPARLAEVKGLGATSITHLKVLQAVASGRDATRSRGTSPSSPPGASSSTIAMRRWPSSRWSSSASSFSTRRTG